MAPPRLSPELKRLLAAGAPAVAASGAAQLILLAGTQVASFTPSALSWLYYADRLFQLPLGFVGAAVGLVLLPEMASRHAGAGTPAVLEAQNRALEAGLLLGLPAAIALALLSRPIVTVLFERGAFGPEDAVGTAAALAGLAAGLPFAVAGKVLSQTFFARHDVRTPILASLLGIVAALGGAAVLARGFGASGIGLGIAAGFAAHAAALVWRLRHAGLWRPDSRLKLRVGGGLVASAAMALAIAGAGLGVDVAVGPNRGRALDAAILLGLCLGGLALYVAIAWAVGAIRRDGPGLGLEKA
jgi:putative peptidoglycan lipid II flippase